MEISEKYAYKIWEKKSFSEAAKDLYVSQPSLSATIARLEKKLGFKIFDRSSTPLSLTPQGRIYMDFLEESTEVENTLYQRIRALGDMTYGSLTVGGQIYAAIDLLPKICGEFYKHYPEIGVTVDIGSMGGMNNLFEKMKRNMLDLMLTYKYDPEEYQATPLFEERLVFVMPKSLAGADKLTQYAVSREEVLQKKYPPHKEIEDYSIFRSIKFVNNRENSDTAERMARILGDYDVAPYATINVKQIDILYNMMLAGIGAVMVSDLFIANFPQRSDDLLYFIPKSQHAKRNLYIIKKKGMPHNAIVESFIAIASSLCKSLTFLK